MNYTYTIRKVSPENSFLGVIYHSDGMPDHFHNFNTTDFSAANVAALIEGYSNVVRLAWENAANPPVSEVNEGDQGGGVAVKYVYEPEPAHDPYTEKVVTTEVYDAATETITYTKTVEPMTSDEIVQVQNELDLRRREGQTAAQSAVLTKHTVDPATLSDEELWTLTSAYPIFEVGKAYGVGDMVNYKEFLYEAIQAHTSQADWRPDVASSLWKKYRDYGIIEPWVQPQGAHDAYPLGVTVSHNGSNWTSDVDNNVWEPGVSQWTEVV